jgi:hypothetical protein
MPCLGTARGRGRALRGRVCTGSRLCACSVLSRATHPADINRPLLAAKTACVLCAAELLGVDKDGLFKALSTRTRQTPEGPIVSPLDVKVGALAAWW